MAQNVKLTFTDKMTFEWFMQHIIRIERNN